MLDEEEYSSDTSDEDFIPTGVESDDDDQDDGNFSDEVGVDSKEKRVSVKSKRKSCKKKRPAKRQKINPLLASLPLQSQENCEELSVENGEGNKKDESLWADFLADVEEKKRESQKPSSKMSWSTLLGTKKKASSKPTEEEKTKKSNEICAPKNGLSQPTTVKVTKVFEFAGEEVRVEEEVSADSLEAKKSQLNSQTKTSSNSTVSKPERSSKLENLVGLIGGKRQKLSTLEKSKLDWNNYKASEKIEDELRMHLKSKDGYLDKQDFLERTNLREYELERDMKFKGRSNK